MTQPTPQPIPAAPNRDELAALARSALPHWQLPAGATARLINLSENATFLVEAEGGFRSILRIHRQGYHGRRAIECELAWMAALDAEGWVHTSSTIAGRNGEVIQTVGNDHLVPHHMVMFTFLEGVEPDPDSDLVEPFRALGALAAKMHLHTMRWQKPARFERLVWNDETVFGTAPTWGDWRDAPHVDGDVRAVLEQAERLVRQRLSAYGRGANRYGLIHADMRLANLLVDGDRTQVIDFDDCGYGWFMYDFAAGISFMEDHPQVPALREAWVAGYRSVRDLADADVAEIDSFIMLRRMALLAWVGSHAESDLPRQLAPHFAEDTARIAKSYLASMTGRP